MNMRWNDKPYHTLDYEMKMKYGEKIYKIALDAGATGRAATGAVFFAVQAEAGILPPEETAGIPLRPSLKRENIIFMTKKQANAISPIFRHTPTPTPPPQGLKSYTVRRLMSRLSWEYP